MFLLAGQPSPAGYLLSAVLLSSPTASAPHEPGTLQLKTKGDMTTF